MRYVIEADWHLLNACNYRCAYCFFTPAVLGEKLQTVASPRQWQTAFDRTRLKWLLHMTGGEPSIYPNFVELCRLLTEDHFISINSNLTNACLVDFAEKIEPKRVSFINAGMHLEERDFRRGHAKFLHHAQLLHAKGFPILVSLGRVDGFDQDEAESKRDERAVILRRFLASKCDTLEAFELADRLFDACP